MTKKTLFKILALVIVALVILFFVAQKQSATVTIERTLNAPIEKVWILWGDAEAMKKWWSPKHFTAPVIQNDFRPDGKFLFSMQAPDGKISWNAGTYLEIIPYQKIVSRMSFSDENGNTVPASHYGVPGDWPESVTVTVEFKDLQGKTLVKIQETGIPMIMYIFAKMGWEQQFDKFEELLK